MPTARIPEGSHNVSPGESPPYIRSSPSVITRISAGERNLRIPRSGCVI
jgi:hypothetical protein